MQEHLGTASLGSQKSHILTREWLSLAGRLAELLQTTQLKTHAIVQSSCLSGLLTVRSFQGCR